LYDGPGLSKDKATRRLIRQHAMRDVAVARRSNNVRRNQRQLPLFLTSEEQQTTENEEVPRSIKSFEAPRDFELLVELMPLTGLRLGIATLAHLIPEASRSTNTLSLQPHTGNRKLLTFIPSRYDQVALLRHATDAVLAKLRQIVLPDSSEDAGAKVLVHYNKALRSLQAALNNEKERMMAETLCATELLTVFETLTKNPNSDTWARHVNGAARLIQVRGPKRFDTEFERALFLAHVGPTVSFYMCGHTSTICH
jgi:hypothetical protein